MAKKKSEVKGKMSTQSMKKVNPDFVSGVGANNGEGWQGGGRGWPGVKFEKLKVRSK